MGSNDMPELGSKISLISKADIRYEGKLFTVDPQDCTIALASVRSFGTEDRVTDHPVPAQAQVYDYILFRATDIKDISVIPSPPVLYDPAIVQLSVPPTIGAGSGSRFPSGGFQHPILGQLGGSASSENATRPIGSGAPGSYNPMQSTGLLNPLQQRSRQTSESQRHPGSVADLIGGSAAVGTGREGGGNPSRSSTPGLSRRISMNDSQRDNTNQRQSPPRYGDRQNNRSNDVHLQRNRHNSQGNSSNHEDRSYGSRQYSQSKPREQQQPRYGNRNMDNGFNKEPRMNMDNNGSGYNNQRNNDMSYQNRNNDMGYQNRNNQPQQQRRYQGTIGQQNQQRNNSRGTSGDRQQEQRTNNMSGQRRPQQQGWNQHPNNMRQPMMMNRQGGYNNMRQGMNQRRRQTPFVGFNQGQPKPQQNKTIIKFDSDYDFDKANTEFEELRLTLAQVKIGDGAGGEGGNDAAVVNQGENDKKDDSGNETAVGDCEQDEDGTAYDKTKSFFDNISCEAIERSKGRSQRTDWRKELKLNTETFGVSLSRRFFLPRRGGYYNHNRGNNWNYKPRTQQHNSNNQPQQNIIAAKV